MNRITKVQAKIRDAHIRANQNNSWTNPKGNNFKTMEEAKVGLLSGATSQDLYDFIEGRFCTITGSILSGMTQGQYLSGSQKAGLSKGFKATLGKLGIS